MPAARRTLAFAPAGNNEYTDGFLANKQQRGREKPFSVPALCLLWIRCKWSGNGGLATPETGGRWLRGCTALKP